MSEEKQTVEYCVGLIANRLKAFRELMRTDQCITIEDYYMLADIPRFEKTTLAQYMETLATPDDFQSDYRCLCKLQAETQCNTLEDLQCGADNIWCFLIPQASPVSTVSSEVLKIVLVVLTKNLDFVNAARLMLLTRSPGLGENMRVAVAFAILFKLFAKDPNCMRPLCSSGDAFVNVYQLLVYAPPKKLKKPPQILLRSLMMVSKAVNSEFDALAPATDQARNQGTLWSMKAES